MSATEKDEPDIIALARTLWGFRVLIIVLCLVGGGIAAVLAFTAIPIYRAEVVITAAPELGTNGGGVTSQLGGLASLAGLGMPQTGKNQANDALLESHYLVEEFIRRNGLLEEISGGTQAPKSLWRAVKKFIDNVLTIRKDTRKGVTVVSVEWKDPVTAARWANGLVALANELIRARALDESTRNIKYLKEQIARTDVVELRKVFYDIIEDETKQLMLASGRVEYAFQVIDPAVPPEIRIRPRRAITVLIGLLGGFFTGVVVACVIAAFRRRPAPASQVSGSQFAV